MALFNPNIKAAAEAAAKAAPTAPLPTASASSDSFMNALSRALSTDVVVAPPGMVRPYMAHQAAAHVACNAAITNHGCAFLGDDMGMGKTQVLQALAAERVANGGYAIMIAPPVALTGYRMDCAAAFPSLRLAQVKGRTADFASLPEADLYFISDDTLTLKAWLTHEHVEMRNGAKHKVLTATAFATGAKFLSRDEIHRDKGAQGRPTTPTSRSAIMLALGAALRERSIPIVAATGTLTVNKAVDAVVPLQTIGGTKLLAEITRSNAATAFLYRYCKPEKIWNGHKTITSFSTDYSKLGELHERLRDTVYVRREKSDLGDILPNGAWLLRPFALNGAMRRYDAIARDVLKVIQEENGPAAYMRAARAEKLREVMMLWEEAGKAKIGAAAEYIEDLVDQGRKVVAFYWHDSIRDGLSNKLSKAHIKYTVIAGKVTGDAREHAIRAFQDGAEQVVLAQIQASGMAVTLTASADAVFVQVPWSGGVLKQCADRILRVDDRTLARARNGETVTWHVLQSCYDDGSPTIDSRLWEVLQQRCHAIDAINAGRPITMSDENVTLAVLEAWYADAQARYGSQLGRP